MSFGGCGFCYTCQKECSMCVTCEKGYAGGNRPQQQVRRRSTDWRSVLNINSLTVFPTNLCNLRCSYCFIYNYPRTFGENMTMKPETAKKVVLWLYSVSTSSSLRIHWFGGEPLVAYELIKDTTEWTTKYCRAFMKKMRWGLTSNLTLIDDEVNEFLKKYDYSVLCSIDGLSVDHDKHRVYPNKKGSWKDAIAGLDRLLEWKDPRNLTVRWTISKDTMKSVVDGTKFFVEKKGIPNIAHEFVYEVEWEPETIAKLEKKFIELIPWIVEKFKEENLKIELKPFRDGMRAFNPVKRMSDRCGLAKNDLGVDVDGNLFTCHRFVDQKDFYIGNIHTGLDFNKVRKLIEWDMSKIRSADRGYDRCFTCPAKMGCNAGCMAVNYDTTGNVYIPPKCYCDLHLMKFRLAVRLRKELMSQGLWRKWNSNTKRGKN